MPVSFVLAIIVFAGAETLKAEAKKKPTDWNSPSLSFFYNEQSIDELTKSLPSSEWDIQWDIQPMLWPTEEEIGNCRGTATESQKKECVKGIKEYIKDEWVPDELASYLLPLKKWAKPSISWKDERKADVFLCRYCAGNYLIQIMDGNWAMIVTVKEITNIPPLKKDDHKDFVSKIFRAFWKGDLLKMRLAEHQAENITRGGINFGERWVTFVTDGKFVKFEIKKRLPGPRAFPDPYEPIFASPEKSLKELLSEYHKKGRGQTQGIRTTSEPTKKR